MTTALLAAVDTTNGAPRPGARTTTAKAGGGRTTTTTATATATTSCSAAAAIVRLLFLLDAGVALVSAASSSGGGGGTSAKTNTKKAYPNYCSDHDSMAARSIPPLSPTSLAAHPHLRLLQAHVLIRHGARTPDHPSQCWTGYDETWDCEMTALMAPHDMADAGVKQGLGGIVTQFKGDDASSSGTGSTPPEVGQFLFEKVYDALRPPLFNTLGGTCNVGQIIKKGYEQELMNGKHLRKAYIEGEDYMRLFVNASYNEGGRPYGGSTRFRGDDNPRVMLSGQTLVRGLFDVKEDVVVPFHTAEHGMDPIYTNKKICPRLRQLEKSDLTSREFRRGNNSVEARALDEILESTNSNWDHILDCLMTQICNDRPLHPSYNDFTGDDNDDEDGDSNSVFMRVVRHHTWQRIHHYRTKKAQYAKLAMGPLWAEILSTLVVTKDKSVTDLQDMQKAHGETPLLLLYSGHDSTIMPFLSTLGEGVWDGVWTPYGSMVVIESYNVGTSDYKFPSGKAFRIIFNGQLLTPAMCDGAELCDLNILLKLVRPFATWHRQCGKQGQEAHKEEDEEQEEQEPEENVDFVDDDVVVELYDERDGGDGGGRRVSTGALVGIIVMSCLVASVLTLVGLTRTRYGRAWLSCTNLGGYERVKSGDNVMGRPKSSRSAAASATTTNNFVYDSVMRSPDSIGPKVESTPLVRD